MSPPPTTSAQGYPSPTGKLQHSPSCSEEQNVTAATDADVASGAAHAATLRRIMGAKNKSVEQNNCSPLFLTFETVPQDATHALLLAASDLAVVAEADGRYEDVFAASLTPEQLQQQQMLEDHLRELVREALQVDALLKTFAAAFDSGPGRYITSVVPAPQLSAHSHTDSLRRAAAAAQAVAAATPEAREHLGGDSSRSSSQTVTRCTSAAAKPPPFARLHTSNATPVPRGAAAVDAEGGRLRGGGPLSTGTAAAETTSGASYPHDGKEINSSEAQRQQCGVAAGCRSPSGVGSSTSAAATSPTACAAAFETAAAAGAADCDCCTGASSTGLEAVSAFQWANFHGQQREPQSEEQRSTSEAAAPIKGKGEAEWKDEGEEEDGNAIQQTLQQDSLCDFFINIVRFCYREQFSAAETSTLLGIMKQVLQSAVLKSQTALESFRHFKHLLLKYSVQRPPLSIRVFSPRTLQTASSFVVNTFYRHFQLYVQCFIPQVHAVTVQQPVAVTTLGRTKLSSRSAAAAASTLPAAALAGKQQSLWSEACGGVDATAACGVISSNESSPVDAFVSTLPEETNDPLA